MIRRLRDLALARTAPSLLVVVVAILAVRSSAVDWNDVPTGSMQPTIAEGDRIVVNKLAYDLRAPFLGRTVLRLGDPCRGDIVVFSSPDDGVRLVKRVVGVPGDRVALSGNRLEVAGRRVRYGPLANREIEPLSCPIRGRVLASERVDGVRYAVMVSSSGIDEASFGPVVVPADHYFVLGDNRDASLDSRTFGFVPRDRIAGRVVGVAASLDPEAGFAPRWNRFLVALR